MSKIPHIALLCMLKNEEKRLHITLNSVLGFVNSLVIFDTGSTDKTISILEEFSKKHGIPLRLKQGEFIDFSSSRNESLDFADTFEDIDYVLLLDCNDELKNGSELVKLAKENIDKSLSAFLLCQEWFSGHTDKFFNVRFIKTGAGWRYKCVVHEYIRNIKLDNLAVEDGINLIKPNSGVIIFQDRTQDDDKSFKRFIRDKELLLEEYRKDSKEPRTVFYLAQTCSCLRQYDDAYYYYNKRTQIEDGFWEERFVSWYRCGSLAEKLDHGWYDIMPCFMKAIEIHHKSAEPYVHIADHYIKEKKWDIAYMFIKQACRDEVKKEGRMLFLESEMYDYHRWKLLSIVASHMGKLKEGKIACLKAINAKNLDSDKHILKFYTDKEETGVKSIDFAKTTTKKEFMDKKIIDLKNEDDKKKKNTMMTKKQLESKANEAWKKYRC